ncbi:MAG TPA: oxygen-independent coproporphyrinogen III oxidase [Caulobacteraceae bacterium]
MTVHSLVKESVEAGRVADQRRLIAKYDGRVPRYTSYPTAVQFTPAVTPDAYLEWLAAIPVAQPVSVYVHVPFCARLCWFCGCHTRVMRRAQPISDYVRWLRTEATLIERVLPKGVWANDLHLGGGTPNLLSRDDLVDLFGILRHVFKLAPGAEISAEIDPTSLTQDWVRAAAHHGLSRASLGVQDLSPLVQAAVNRREDFDTIDRGVGWLRAAGIRSINLDLMYGLPRQSVDDVVSSLDKVLGLAPDRIALFGYAHVPWMKPHQNLIDAADLPGSAARLEQSQTAAVRLEQAGYVRVGLDHYALPDDDLARSARAGRLRRNFQGYVPTASETLIGLGASAISQTPSGFAQNLPTELQWRGALIAGQAPIARGCVLTGEDRFRGEIIERLMCDLAVDLAQICRRHDRALESLNGERAQLEPMRDDGLITIDGDRVAATEQGRPFIRAVCAVFDRYLQPVAARHAPAI